MKQNTPEWHASRVGRVTGSRAGAILGLSPYATRDDVMRQMVREYHGAENEIQDNPAFAWGRANESTAIGIFEMKTGLNVEETGFHEHEEWAGASPDGLIGNDALIECKCPFGLRNKDVPNFKTLDEQPHYYAQIQMELVCTGRSKAYFFQWAPKGNVLVEVKRDQNWIDTAMPELRKFYEEYIAELDNPEHLEPLRVEVNTNATKMLLAEYDELSEAIDNATERKKEVLAELVASSGEKNALLWGRKLSKVQKAGAVSYARVVKKHCPDVDLESFRGKASEYWKLS